MYTDTDIGIENDDHWESRLMLKDSRWSLTKGKKRVTKDMSLKITPLIIRHDNFKATNITVNPVTNFDLSDLQDDPEEGEIEQDEPMEEPMEEPRDPSDPAPKYNKTLISSITIECPRMNESTFRGTINYSEAKEKIFIKALGLSPDLLTAVE